MKSTLVCLGLLMFSLAAGPAYAELVCGRVTNVRGKLTIQSKTVTLTKCPRGYSPLIDTSLVQGPAGAPGTPGTGPGENIPSGITVIGLFAHRAAPAALNQNFSAVQNFGFRLPADISNSNVVIKANQVLLNACGSDSCLASDDRNNQSFCTGTAENPTASPGYVCFYPLVLANIGANLQGMAFLNSRYGFQLFWTASTLDTSFVGGHWAYTAP